MVHMVARLCIVFSCLSVAFLGNCSSGSQGAKCVPGLECPCPTGQFGAWTCMSAGTFGACVCSAPTVDGGAAAAGSDGAATSSPDAPAATGGSAGSAGTGGGGGMGATTGAGGIGAGGGTTSGGIGGGGSSELGGAGGGGDAGVPDAPGGQPAVPIGGSGGGAGGISAVVGTGGGPTVSRGGTPSSSGGTIVSLGGTTGSVGGTISTGGAPTTDGGGAGGGTASNCGITTASLTQVPADLLLVLDRSGSMINDMASDAACGTVLRGDAGTCTTRWSAMIASLNQVLTTFPAGVQWGLKLFTSPGGGMCTVNAGADVPLPATAAQVQAAIAAVSPANQTPTTAAINAAVAYYATVNDGRSHNILLATDGQPNCDPGTSSIVSATSVANAAAAIKAAFDAGIKTYVIGIGPSAGNLTSFAQNGGTNDYYPATSPDQLTAALTTVAAEVASCVFNLGKMPPDPNNVVVEFDGNSSLRAPRDTTLTNGWDYTSSADTAIQFYGSWCNNVINGTFRAAMVLMGCGDIPTP